MLGFEGENEKNELVAGVNEGFLKLCSTNLPQSASVKDKERFMGWLSASMPSFYPAIERDLYRTEPKEEETYLMAISLFEKMLKNESEVSMLEQMALHPLIQGAPIYLIDAIRTRYTRVGK